MRRLYAWLVGVAIAASLLAIGPGGPSSSVAGTAFSPDIGITKVDSADPVTVGETFDYTLRVEHLGPTGNDGPATDVVVRDAFPASLEVVAFPPECSLSGNDLECDLGTINLFESRELTVTVRPNQAGDVVNTADVSTTSPDPEASNNSESETTGVVAAPTPQRTLTVIKDGTGAGTVTSSPAGIDCGADCSEAYDENSSIFLTATPDGGSDFAGWAGDCAGSSGDTCVVSMDADKTALASFEPTPQPTADLSITKTDSADAVTIGEEFDYTLRVENLGPDGADNVLVTDAVPFQIEVIDVPPECELIESTVQCELGEMGNGGSRELTFTVRANQEGEVTNTAQVSSGTSDPESSNNSESETTTVVAGPTPQRTLTVVKDGDGRGTVTSSLPGIDCGSDCSEPYDDGAEVILTATPEPGSDFAGWSGDCLPAGNTCRADMDADKTVTATFDAPPTAAADLSIAKTDSADPVNVGEEFDYTLAVDNLGPNGAGGVTVRDQVPDSLELVTVPEACTFGEGTLECDLGEMGNGGFRELVITVRATATGAVTNTATVSSDSPDPFTDNNSDSQTTTINAAQRTLTVTKGGAGFGNVSSSPTGIDCGADCSEEYDDGTLADLTATPDPGSRFAGWGGLCSDVTGNTCTVTMDGDATIPATFEREDGADLTIAKSESQDPVEVRDGFTYTLEVENLGPGGAADVTVTDQLPASVEVIDIPGECTRSASTVTCDLGELGNGAQRSLDIIVQPQGQGTISNSAEVSSTTPDPDETNDSDTEATTVIPRTQHTLTVTKDGTGSGTVTSDPPGIDCGADCTEDYDNGSSIDVTATPDPGSEFAGWEGDCGEISGETCFDVQMSEDKTVKATFNADAPQADLAITKADSPDPVAVGETLTYTLGVQNDGPAGTDNVVITDALPASVETIDIPDECTQAEDTLTCELGEMGNGGSRNLTVTVRPTEEGEITNAASVAHNTADPSEENNSTAETTTVNAAPPPERTLTVTKGGDGSGNVSSEPPGIDCGADCSEPYDENTMVDLTATPDPGSVFAGWSGACAGQPDFQCTVTMDDDQTATAIFDVVPEPQADLSIEKTDSKDPVTVDEAFDYTLTVRNNGPDGADGVLVTDLVPFQLEVVSLPEECELAESTIQCELGEMGNGGQRTLTIRVRATQAGDVTNSAFVTASSPADHVSGNNSESETTTVRDAPTPQRTLTVTKGGDGTGTVTSDPAGINCGSDCQEAYDDGTDVTLTATPDPGSVFSGWSGACGDSGSPSCTLEMEADQTATATFDAVDQPTADLSIIKEDASDPVAVDERFDYTFTVRNLGPDGADGVRVVDRLPASIEVESLPEECTVAEGILTCDLGEMGNGGERTVTVGVSANEAGTITNLAQVSSNDDDPFTPNDSDSEVTTVGEPSQPRTLTVEKRGSGSGTVTSAPAGIDCGNDCTEEYEDGTTVTLTASAAPGSRFDGWGRGVCRSATGNTCQLTMDADKRVTPTFTALPPGTDLAITKTDSTGDGVVETGEIFDYTLRVENLRAAADDEVRVLDELPGTLDVIYVPPECGLDDNNVLDCDLGRVAGGESRVLTITVRPTSVGTLQNTATVSGAEDDPVFMNNSDTNTVFAAAASSRPRTLTVTKDGAGSGTVASSPPGVNCGADCQGTYPEGSSVTLTATPSPGSAFAGWAGDCAGATGNTCTITMNVDRAARATFIPSRADLVIAKSDSLDPVEVNEPFEYTLAVRNTGPDTAEDVVVTDDLPAALEVIAIPDECQRTGNALRCELGDLADEETRNLTVRVRATAAGSVENTARAFGSVPDPVAGNDSDSETTTVSAPPAGSRTLTVTKDGTGSGTVSSFPGGIDCGDDCSQSYADGATVTLTAEPATGSAFAGWAGDCAEAEQSRTCELTMDGDKSVRATFNDAPPADLVIDKSDSPDPVIVGDEFDYTLEAGNLGPNTARGVRVGDALPAGVELVEAPPECTDEENLVTCDLGDIPANEAVSVAIRVRATVTGTVENTAEVAASASSDPVAANDTDTETTTVRPEQRTLTVTKGGAGQGTVTSSPAGIDCGTDCTESYDEGTGVTLTATPAPGSFFARWEPACAGAERNTCDVVLDEDTSVRAIFEPAQPGADLEITKSDSQDPVELRERFRYTLRVENFGRDTAAGVQVVDDIPEGVDVVSLPNECLFAQNANRRVLCFPGSIPAGATRSLDLLMEPTRVGSVTNTASVASNTPDPRQVNNVDSETTTMVKGNDRAIARWPLNIRDFDTQGPFTPDVSGNFLTGRDAQAAVVPGRFRNAFSLDGEGDGFTVPQSDGAFERGQLEPPDANGLSVVAWVRSQPGGLAPGANETIVAKGGRGCRAPSYYLSTGQNGGLEFSVEVQDAAGTAGAPNTVVRTSDISPATVWNANWHAVTAVYGAPNEDGSRNIAVWVDGRRVAGAEIPETSLGIDYTNNHILDQQLTVGRTPPDSTQFNPNACTDDRSLNAQLDDVRIYGEALDRREIRFLHNPNAQSPPFLDEDTAPLNTVRPQISGTPTPASELSCTQGSWTGNDSGPVTYTTVWERAPRATNSEDDQSWAPIDGAVGPRYTVQDIDLGSRVRCRVTRTDAGGTTDASSRSLRVDLGPPENVVAPQIVGIPATDGRFVTCEPGQWTNGPSEKDFSYQWVSAGQLIPGATSKTYKPRQRRVKGGFRVVNPDGDGDRFISCQVTARNDVGSRLHNSQAELAVDDVPIFPSAPGAPVIQAPGETGVSATANVKAGEAVTCSNGRIGGQDVNWVDGYGDKDYYRARGFSLTFEWFRQGTAIPGESGRTYTIRFDDLGRDLQCRITNTNPLGSARTAISITKRINLPEGERDSTIYQVGGINQADPRNLLALSDDYRRIVQEESKKRLTAGLKRVEEDCRARNDIPAEIYKPANPADIEGVQRQIDDRARCQIILRAPLTVRVVPEGVRYIPPAPAACSIRFAGDFPLCPNLRIQVAPIDPKNPPATDTELAAKLAPVTPDRYLWDLDRDGRTDAVCPGSAPVLRTIYNPGNWNPRVVIVDKGSEKLHFTDTFFTAPGKKTVNTVVRSNQVRVCSTAFDPPPNPEKTPCITEGQVGRVRLEGDLCPIDAREINPLDFDNFDGQIYQMLLAQSEERLKGEGVQTASARRDANSTEPIWLDLGKARAPKHRFFAGIAQSIPGFDQVSATYVNSVASLSGVRPGSTLPDLSGNLKQKLDTIPSFKVPDAGFAMNQVYIARGDAMKLNGTTVDPLGDSAALVVPSDVKGALGSVTKLSVSARNAASYLGGKANGIPLADGGNLQQQLSDAPTQALSEAERRLRAELEGVEQRLRDARGQLEAELRQKEQELRDKIRDEAKKLGQDLLRESNLDQLVQKLQGAADKLDLGPFKLRGTAQVKVENDGTASLTAKAVLPGLKLGVGKSTEASAEVTLRADPSGKVKLGGLRIKPPGIAYLGGVSLNDLDLAYDGGLDVKGKILFPPPVAAGIAINRFKLGPKGEFQILDVDFLAGAGSGIQVTPGIFITKLGAKLNLIDDIVGGNATVSVGPATGGGCPTVGINAGFDVHFAEQYYLDARGVVQLACIDLVNIDFHADQSGLVTLDGRIDQTLGPLFIKVALGAAIKLPNWQATASGSGGIRIPVVGTVSAGFKLVLSNIGLAGCATLKLPVVPDVSGGAAVRFRGGRPPLSPVELIANLRFFVGCDLSEYQSVVQRAVASGSQAGSTSFVIPRGAGPSLLSIEGAGEAPRVRLRSPSGRTFDFTDAISDGGKTIGPARGAVIEPEDRTVVFLGRAEAGTWTAEVAEGSTRVVRVQRADILPKPEVTARVTGRGTRRVLRYRVKPIDGQKVRLVEMARGGLKVLRTVQRGGRGQVSFRVSESNSRQRRIVAQVIQDDLPREDLTVARYSAPNPRVGKAKRIRIRRRGGGAVITWKRASFSRGHEVIVRTGTGRGYVIRRRRTQRLRIRRVRPKEGVVVRVVAFSPGGRRGKYVTARLPGSMRVGAVRRAKVKHPNVVRRGRARERRAGRRRARGRSRTRARREGGARRGRRLG